MSIDKFDDEFFFLSNFFPAETAYEGVVYPTSEHAYQAAKSLDPKEREMILKLDTPSQSKKIGKRVKRRPDWEQVKVGIMRSILLDKFLRNSDLSARLLATSGEELIEGNWWQDTEWGVYNGKGENKLGKLLMEIREQLREAMISYINFESSGE